MAAKNTGYRKLTGAEQRALAEQLAQADPAAEALGKERSFLKAAQTAQDDLIWLISNEAWTVLGFDTFAEWWDARVSPVLAELPMLRPTREVAQLVIERVRAEDELRPKSQRRTSKQLAAMVGVSAPTARRSASRSLRRSGDAEGDLEKGRPVIDGEVVPDRAEIEAPKSPLAEAMTQAIEETQDLHPNGVGTSGTPAGTDASARVGGESGPVPVATGDGPDVTPEHEHVGGSTGGPGECSAECACGIVFDGFDTHAEAVELLARHIDNAQDSSPEASEASPQGEAPADGTVNPSPSEGTAVATPAEPGTEPPVSPGEAPTPRSSAAGVGPLPDGAGSEAVEDGAGPSSSTDPLDELGDGLTDLIHLLDEDRFDPDVRGPMATEAQLNRLHRRVDHLAEYVGLLERWRNK